jgi:hypothetical protein
MIPTNCRGESCRILELYHVRLASPGERERGSAEPGEVGISVASRRKARPAEEGTSALSILIAHGERNELDSSRVRS